MKYFISILSHARPQDSVGVVRLVVEYMALDGPVKSGKVEVTIPAAAFFQRKYRAAVAKALGVSTSDLYDLV